MKWENVDKVRGLLKECNLEILSRKEATEKTLVPEAYEYYAIPNSTLLFALPLFLSDGTVVNSELWGFVNLRDKPISCETNAKILLLYDSVDFEEGFSALPYEIFETFYLNLDLFIE